MAKKNVFIKHFKKTQSVPKISTFKFIFLVLLCTLHYAIITCSISVLTFLFTFYIMNPSLQSLRPPDSIGYVTATSHPVFYSEMYIRLQKWTELGAAFHVDLKKRPVHLHWNEGLISYFSTYLVLQATDSMQICFTRRRSWSDSRWALGGPSLCLIIVTLFSTVHDLHFWNMEKLHCDSPRLRKWAIRF